MYGWEAIMAVLDNKIDGDTFVWLLEAGRRMEKQETYNRTKASFLGTLAANAKSPSNAFQKITSKLIKNMKADNE